jgi:hypothetical protein
MYTGPRLNKNGMLFGYDTGYGSTPSNQFTRLYPGKPVTNLLTGIGYSFGTQDTATFKTNYGTETSYVPTLGERTTHFVNIFNDYNGGSGACCPSPFSYGEVFVSPSTVYTYQIIFKTSNNYYSPNYMYQYQFNGGTYVTEFGLLDGSRIEELGNGWRHGWGTFTTNASTTRLLTFLFHYEYAFFNKIEIAGVSITQGNTVLRPYQIPNVGQTRSATRGLIDASRRNVIDISNVSFNTNGNMVFDGSDDFINVPTSAFPAMDQITIELVNFGIDARNSSVIAGGIGGNQDLNIHLPWGDGNIYWDVGRPFNRVFKAAGSEYIGWHHWVFTKNSSTGIMNIYRDGVLWAQNTGQTSPIISLAGGTISVGRYSNGSTNAYHHNGTVPVMRVQNVELTAAQVAENFLVYKNRFGI